MTNENPWKTLSTRLVYENPWMRVHEDRVIAPDGSETIYGHMEVPRAAGVLAITEEDEVLLVGQYRYPTKQYTWEIIEGAVEEDETPEESARRELLEEAGVECDTLVELGAPFYTANSRSNEWGQVFLAKGLRFGEPNPESTEVLMIKRVPLKEVVQMLRDGDITDAISILAIQRYVLNNFDR